MGGSNVVNTFSDRHKIVLRAIARRLHSFHAGIMPVRQSYAYDVIISLKRSCQQFFLKKFSGTIDIFHCLSGKVLEVYYKSITRARDDVFKHLHFKLPTYTCWSEIENYRVIRIYISHKYIYKAVFPYQLHFPINNVIYKH